MLVDFHAHIFPSAVVADRDYFLQEDPSFAELYADPDASLATVDDLIASMDEAGIDVSVALNFGWESPRLCVATNDYIMEAVARHPKRLVGFGAVALADGEAAAREAERCAKGGLRGLGELRPDREHADIGDAATMAPLAAAARENDLLLLFHASEPVGHRYPGKGSATPDMLLDFITSFSGLRIVLAHWGGGLPFYALMPEIASTLGSVYFDTAAWSLLYRPQVFDVVMALVGDDHVLFGTDYPLLSQRGQLRHVQRLGLRPEAETRILGGNAVRLLRLAEGCASG